MDSSFIALIIIIIAFIVVRSVLKKYNAKSVLRQIESNSEYDKNALEIIYSFRNAESEKEFTDIYNEFQELLKKLKTNNNLENEVNKIKEFIKTYQQLLGFMRCEIINLGKYYSRATIEYQKQLDEFLKLLDSDQKPVPYRSTIELSIKMGESSVEFINYVLESAKGNYKEE